MTPDFLPPISPGWVVMFLDTHRTVFTFLSWLALLCDVLAFWISNVKFLKSLAKCHRVTDITSFEKHLESSLCHILSFYPNLVNYRFKNMFLFLSPGLLQWSCLPTKESHMQRELRLIGLELQVHISKDGRNTHWKLKFYRRAITHVNLSQMQQKSHLICITSRQFHILKFE